MMFKSLTFGDINSKDLDMYISGTGAYDAPSRAFEMIDVPGRNGQLSIDGGRYENIEVTYPAGVFAESEEAFREKMANIRAAFLSKVGYQRLTDEYNPDEYRLGIFSGGIEADPVARLKASEFDITFNCKPQRFLTSGEETVNIGEYSEPVGTDNAPYLFRRSPQFAESYDSCIPTIVGGSVVGNQLVPDFDASNWSLTANVASVSDGELYVQPTATWQGATKTNVSVIAGHKYFESCVGRVETSGTSVSIGDGLLGVHTIGNIYSTSNTTIATIVSATATITGNYNVGNRTGVANYYLSKPQLIDLTAMLGTSIADRAYAMEQAQAGSGIAWLKSYGFISDSYEAYDTGTLKSVEATEHVTRGVNWFDKSTATDGKYINASGVEIASANYGHSDFIRVFPNMHFYMNGYAGSGYYSVLAYDENKTPMANYYGGASKTAEFDLTLPSNCYYVVLNYLLTQKDKMCFNVYDPSVNGQSIPYEEHTYTLGNVTLRGVPKVDANDNIYYDGDTYASDGTVTRKYANIDLGTLTWNFDNPSQSFWADCPYDGKKLDYSPIPCSIMPKYDYYSGTIANMSSADKVYSIGNKYLSTVNSRRLFIRDSAYSTTAAFKTAMSSGGVYLVYEKATPTTETADPYTTPMLCDPSGTEEWVTSNGVPVGHQTEYGPDPTKLHNPTLFASKPLIKVTGTGTLGVGSYTMTITGTASQQLYIDCDLMEAWEDVGGARVPRNDRITYAGNKFPELDPGETGITADGITAVEIVPRWWTL